MKPSTDGHVKWRIQSRQADVVCIQTDSGDIVEKRIVQATGPEEAEWINAVSRHFRKRLANLGVPLAEPYKFEVRGHTPVQTSPYAGVNLETIIGEHEAPTDLLSTLLRAIKGVLEQTTSEVGIDARLSNFCSDGRGNIFYVDTFPPLVVFEGRPVVHFPNPTDKETIAREVIRKLSPMGILRRLRFSILEQRNSIGEPELLTAILDVMGESFWRRVKDFFGTLPGNISREEALSKIHLDDPDWTREVAVSLAPEGLQGRTFVQKAFALSSNLPCNDEPMLPPEERLRQIHLLFESH